MFSIARDGQIIGPLLGPSLVAEHIELRFRAAYDLGWLAVQKAGRTEGESPRDALPQLYRGVEWFREALALRPEDNHTRENLEVAQLRA